MPQDTASGSQKLAGMRFVHRPLPALIVLSISFSLGACQGNLGSGGAGISIPQTQPYGQPGGPGGATTQSRERTLEGAVFLTTDMATLPLPTLDGFALTLALGTPPPSPSPTPSVSPPPSATPVGKHGTAQHRMKTRAIATPGAASPVPRAMPSPAASDPSPAVTSPQPVSSGALAAPASPRASPAASPAVPKTMTKLVVYPDDAPAAPTPQPSGNVQTYAVRKALVRGYIKPGADVPLYGLGALRFTIPAEEDTAQRGYTVALFSAGRRHHDKLVASDARAAIAEHVVASSAVDSLVLKKNTGYLLVLYADELPATPAPVVSGYPSPGINPFVTPGPAGSPSAPPAGSPGGPYPQNPSAPYPH